MAQQQDPNADPARGATGQQGIAAGSQDTYRSPGFKSPTVSTTGNSLSSITGAPPTAALAPTTATWGKYSGALTPGIQAAMGAGGSGQPGAPSPPGIGQGGLLQSGALGIAGKWASNVLGQGNNSQLQDIGGALYQGLPITDADWNNAGYGPGGATLAAPAAAAQQNTLRSIAAIPFGIAPSAASAAMQKTQQPAGTIPTNAVLKY